MYKILKRNDLRWWFVPLALLVTASTYAETFAFSYTHVGTNPGQVYAPGAVLSGQIDGTIDPMNPDRVIVNSFGAVVLSRPGLPLFEYASIDSTEFNTNPISGNTVEMSFSGTILNFRSCPEGFTSRGFPHFDFIPPFDDCPFSTAPGGGFLMSYSYGFAPLGFTTANDGNGSEFRVSDVPIFPDNWSLVVLPDSADVDPSVVIGSGSEISKGVVVEEGVVLGENVTANKDASIGANTTIGNNVFVGKDDVIEDSVDVGNDTTINKGVHICSGATVGSAVTIGKNNLVLNGPGVDVPDGIVWNGLQDRPGDCP